jgi:hypothetical protein
MTALLSYFFSNQFIVLPGMFGAWILPFVAYQGAFLMFNR